MSLNKLKLNKEKTELLYLYSKHCSVRLYHHFVLEVIQFIHSTQPEISRCHLWQHYLYALSRVNSLCKSAFYHLPNISCIRKFLSLKTTEILAHAFVSFKLDYCNSLLHNVPKYILKKLQSVKTAAARLITYSRKYDHITPVLLDLHWLPINERIKFKILLLTFKALRQQVPTYIQDLVIRYSQPRTFRSSCSLRLNPVIFNQWSPMGLEPSLPMEQSTWQHPFMW